ncbi:MAG TPA: hypothetical protein H9815_01300 [Candidatus Ruania gallistercoris]|uniref:Colicin import membrane protein n=1 Tax=Candidatus Ruania gallistercoris TaxID=2838746 RepID=A0A9D2J2C1_9MICO|nr:hypothetical protein [Candidatus Ruania gallistercoris]
MTVDSDGIEEAIEGQLRVLVTAAGQVGERLARLREDSLRRAQARSEQEARELQSRIEAEKRAARVDLANTHRADWWERATPEEIARTYQTTRAWLHEEPEAARAEGRMGDELRSRYGIDVNDTGADPEAVRQLVRLELERAERDLANAEAEGHRGAAEDSEAQRLLAQANQEEARAEAARDAAEHEPDPDERVRAAAEAEQREAAAESSRGESALVYDSAERRDGMARDLEGKGIGHEVVATRMRADVSQAQPATEAVSGKATRAKARKGRGRAAQLQRADRGR